MSYQPYSFTSTAQLPIEDSPYANLVKNLMQSIQGGMELRQLPEQQRIANALHKAQMQEAQAQARLAGAKTKQQQMLADYLQGLQTNVPGEGQNTSSAIGLKDAYMRRLGGLPEETPQEKMQRELETARLKGMQSRAIDREMGTTTNISSLEEQLQGIENTLPELESHIKKTIPWNIWTPWTTGKESEYKTSATRVGENYMNAMNWPKGEGSRKDAIEMFEKPTGQSDESHIKRLRGIRDSLIEKRERLLKQLGRQERQEQRYSDEDIAFTAKKYGLTKDEVRRRLNA